VVTRNVPPNTIAAGNPAKVVRHLDPGEAIVTRSEWLSDPAKISRDFDRIDRGMLQGNTFLHWLRHLAFPGKDD
jgi:carbonic anhydrase/acetyltransferase-like protein (isoleucine patch superfamily)